MATKEKVFTAGNNSVSHIEWSAVRSHVQLIGFITGEHGIVELDDAVDLLYEAERIFGDHIGRFMSAQVIDELYEKVEEARQQIVEFWVDDSTADDDDVCRAMVSVGEILFGAQFKEEE